MQSRVPYFQTNLGGLLRFELDDDDDDDDNDDDDEDEDEDEDEEEEEKNLYVQATCDKHIYCV